MLYYRLIDFLCAERDFYAMPDLTPPSSLLINGNVPTSKNAPAIKSTSWTSAGWSITLPHRKKFPLHLEALHCTLERAVCDAYGLFNYMLLQTLTYRRVCARNQPAAAP